MAASFNRYANEKETLKLQVTSGCVKLQDANTREVLSQITRDKISSYNR